MGKRSEKGVEIVRLIPATEETMLPRVRGLFEAYAASLPFELDFQGFSRELETLPGAYAPPSGCIFGAVSGERMVGCVAVQKLERDIGELKRLYVVPDRRREGIGKRLLQAALAAAREMGYRRIRLDTVASMKEAICLYQNAGFYGIGPYCFNPIAGAAFFEKKLMDVSMLSKGGNLMKQKVVFTKAAPEAIGPYSQAIQVGDWIFASGQIPINPETGEIVAGPVERQTEQVLKNMEAVLAAAGSDLAHVVKTTVYLSSMDDFGVFNETYASFFKEPYPARATVEVAALPKGVLLEIDAIALRA